MSPRNIINPGINKLEMSYSKCSELGGGGGGGKGEILMK